MQLFHPLLCYWMTVFELLSPRLVLHDTFVRAQHFQAIQEDYLIWKHFLAVSGRCYYEILGFSGNAVSLPFPLPILCVPEASPCCLSLDCNLHLWPATQIELQSWIAVYKSINSQYILYSCSQFVFQADTYLILWQTAYFNLKPLIWEQCFGTIFYQL